MVLCVSVLAVNTLADDSVDDPIDAHQTQHGNVVRDPTRPLSYRLPSKAAAKNRWRLDSVLISNKRKLAVINGESVKEQGWIKGAQVTHIESGKVTIMVKGQPQVLTLNTDIRNVKVEG